MEGNKQEINQVIKICSMSDSGKESKGEKEGHVEIEGKSHSNKYTKEERREHHSRLCFFFFFGGLGKPVTNAGGRGTAKGEAMRLRVIEVVWRPM